MFLSPTNFDSQIHTLGVGIHKIVHNVGVYKSFTMEHKHEIALHVIIMRNRKMKNSRYVSNTALTCLIHIKVPTKAKFVVNVSIIFDGNKAMVVFQYVQQFLFFRLVIH